MENIKKVSSWRFEGKQGEFILNNPQKTSGLYFPLANENGMMSAISPLLGGDIKTGQDTYLMEPISVDDLHSQNGSRNFWVTINKNNVWSATGNSLIQKMENYDENQEEVTLSGGFLWQKVVRSNPNLGIMSEVINFVPTNNDQVELMHVTIKNISDKEYEITPTAAIPIYGRSAHNLRDHRHVTSLLNRIYMSDYGIIMKPTLSFDEKGHKPNTNCYFVQGIQEEGIKPEGFIPVQDDYIGEGGSLDWPESVIKDNTNINISGDYIEGYEAVGAIRFINARLMSGESISYTIIMGVCDSIDDTDKYIENYGSLKKFKLELEHNKTWWDKKLSALSFGTSDKKFDLWMKWVELQPILRRIYGCSFLPHHDYGRGGRGWRDLWQDCLALLILEPNNVRELLFNNYEGVRFDGSNATIIGVKPGEFIADRNNIPRTWMDHGAWPYYTTKLYLDLTGDINFLLEQQVYFKDKQSSRSREVDEKWTDEYGCNQKDENGNIYKGTILEHILLEQITAFYNVGEHNNIRLEGADWNDGFDMANEKGESVAFTAFYGSNLMDLSRVLINLKDKLGIGEIEIAKEILVLIDSLSHKIDYNSVIQKNDLLNQYFKLCLHNISGEKINIKVEDLAKDLEAKAQWIINHIRKNEWIKNSEGFEWFNGYYDNNGERLEGDFDGGVRMTLTGQVFNIMGNIADDRQVKEIVSSVNKYLTDEEIGGTRLNSNFKEVKLNMGRCFGFAYGHKENGAMFSHMSVMYMNALYKRGFVKEGYELLKLIYNHACDFEKSRIYPGIPEYFNNRGRGLYHYLTGAASWLLLTMRNEIFGVKGVLGDLKIEPKLVKEQFMSSGEVSIFTVFREKELNITYINIKNLDYNEYVIGKVLLDGKEMALNKNNTSIIIQQEDLDKLSKNETHSLIVELE